MAHRFLHIGCMFPVLPKTLAIDLMLNTTGDEWIRYAFNNWIILTEKSAAEIDGLVRRQLARDDQVLIIGLNVEDRAGLASPWVWEWLDARKKSQVPTLADIMIQAAAGIGGGSGGGLGLGRPPSGLNALRDLVIGPSKDKKR